MSTIKSSADHIVINADGASKDIKFQANGVEKASISSAGAFTSTTIDATKLTGNLPAISGASLTGISSGISTAIYARQLASGTNGGSTTSGSWQRYPLNTELSDPDGIASLSSEQIILTSGKYIINWDFVTYQSSEAGTRLYNVTSSSVIANGAQGRPGAPDYTATPMNGWGYVNLALSATIEVQYRTTTSKATFGLGVCHSTDTEQYANVCIIKVG